jgi:hypothetical protein
MGSGACLKTSPNERCATTGRARRLAQVQSVVARGRAVRVLGQAQCPSFPSTELPSDKTAIECQVAATDAQIDRLVNELYGTRMVDGGCPGLCHFTHGNRSDRE